MEGKLASGLSKTFSHSCHVRIHQLL